VDNKVALFQAIQALFSSTRCRRLSALGGSLLLTALLGGGCSTSSAEPSNDCDSGTESCPCNTDGSCDSGLTCASNVCVFVAGSGGTTTTGSGGDSASGGSGNATASGGTKGRLPGSIDPRPTSNGGSSATPCGACEQPTPVCDATDAICKTCTAEAGCEGDTVCNDKANEGLGACVNAGGEGGAGGASTSGVPAEWTCVATFYGTADGCDCGCGVVDPDCADESATSCGFCGGSGSCNIGTCPGAIDPQDNSTCVPLPAGWTCGAAKYGDGQCDCGCGAADEDCSDATAASCDTCTGCNVDGTCPGDIDPENNAVCAGGWICSPTYYTDTFCDCGCGKLDPTCPDALAASCQWCGGCTTAGTCPGTIDPTSNWTCTAP
jgi:hypothetical protein